MSDTKIQIFYTEQNLSDRKSTRSGMTYLSADRMSDKFKKFSRSLKLTTDKQTNKQTGQKKYAPDHSIHVQHA